MNRRALLGSLVSTAGVLCAGCTRSDTDPSEDGTPADSSTPSPTAEYRVVDRSFTVLANECGTPTGEIDASLEPDPPAPDAAEHVLTVSGLAMGTDSCHTARLATLEPGESGGTMIVDVETYVPDSDADMVCLECLVAIEYELVVTTAGGRPGTVVVTHDGERAGQITLPE